MDPQTLLDTPLLGGTPREWAVALGVSAILMLTYWVVKPLLVRRFSGLVEHSRTRIDDAVLEAIKATRFGLVLIGALYVGSQYLQLSPKATRILDGAVTVAGFLQVGLWAGAMLRYWLSQSRARALAAQAGSAATTLGAIGFIAQVILWSVIVLLALDNLGINITTLVAGLGVGGVAVALAVQNILGDLFASMSIVVDKPFVIGDFIIVDNDMGTVENIGLKTTRLRALSGEQLVFSNSDLLKARVHNYKRMYERRVVFSFGLVYQTPPEKLEAIPRMIKGFVTRHDKVRFERAHFQKFGASSLDFEVVYWVLDADYNLFMDIQQAINLDMVRAFAREDIQFAFPTQTIYAAEPIRVETLPPPDRGDGRERREREPRRPLSS